MKTTFYLLALLFSLSSFAQDITCFESSVFNENYSTKICLTDFGKKQEVLASGFFSGFADIPGFEDSNIILKELKRGRTIKGDPQIIYAPSVLNDGREISISIICAGDYGLEFIADLQDGATSTKSILVVAQAFKGCEELWRTFP